jgi:formate hydrogenlyase subunit 4
VYHTWKLLQRESSITYTHNQIVYVLFHIIKLIYRLLSIAVWTTRLCNVGAMITG